MELIVGWVWSKVGGTADPEICFGFIGRPGYKISEDKKDAVSNQNTTSDMWGYMMSCI